MALPKTIENREYFAFKECNGNPAKRVSVCQEAGETIKVDIGLSGVGFNEYDEAPSVAGSASATIISYTVPVGKVLILRRVDFSGSNRGIYSLRLNTNTFLKRRTYYTKFDGKMELIDQEFAAGDILDLVVENVSTMTGDFNATLQGSLKDE